MSPPPKKPGKGGRPKKRLARARSPGKSSGSSLSGGTPTRRAGSTPGGGVESGWSRPGWRDWLWVVGPGRRLESVGWWVAALLLLLPPIVMLGGLRDPFRLPKQLLTELLVPLSCLFLAFGLRHIERVDWRSVLSLPALRALGPLWLVTVVSALRSPHPEHAREALWSFSLGTLAVLVWSVGLPRKRRLLDLLLLSGFVLAAVAVLQNHEILRPFELATESRRLRLSSLVGNVADLGAYLVLPLLVAQAAAVRAYEERRFRLLAGIAAVGFVLLYAVLLGRTLSAIAALFVSTAVFWLLRAPRRWRLPMVGGALVVGVVGLLLVGPVRQRVGVKLQELRAGEVNDVLTGRLDGWRAGLDMLKREPILGVGPGAYRAEFSTTKLALIEDGVTFWWGHTDGALFSNAHNEYVEVGADLGLAGLLALCWGIWVLLGELRRRPVSPVGSAAGSDREALEWAALASLAVLAITYFPLRTVLVAYPYVLVLAWALEPRRVTDEGVGREEAAEAAARKAA